MPSGHVYFNIEGLGFATGSVPTMKEIVDTMPDNSIAYLQDGVLNQQALTQPYPGELNIIIIVKKYRYKSFALGVRTYISITPADTQYCFANYDGFDWKGWYTLSQASHYISQATYTPAGTILLPGLITNSSKKFLADFTVPESLEYISYVSVELCQGRIRGISGYVDDSSEHNFLNSPYSISAGKATNHKIRLHIDKTSAFANVTNNTPAILQANISFRFT